MFNDFKTFILKIARLLEENIIIWLLNSPYYEDLIHKSSESQFGIHREKNQIHVVVFSDCFSYFIPFIFL